MTITHALAIVFALAGLGTAIAAAFYWRRASQVPVHEPASISDVPELHIMSGHVAFYESSQLNSTAATLTGIAAVQSEESAARMLSATPHITPHAAG
jgi:hypothetical protein